MVEFDDYSGDIFEGITESLAYLTADRPAQSARRRSQA